MATCMLLNILVSTLMSMYDVNREAKTSKRMNLIKMIRMIVVLLEYLNIDSKTIRLGFKICLIVNI